MNKDEIRAIMLSKRYNLNKDVHKMLSEKAVQKIKEHELYKQAKTVGLYHPIKNELDITALTKDLKTFALPRVEASQMYYDYYDKDSILEKSALHIFESKDRIPLKDKLDLVIVPALAVDVNFNRVGYGKGFFDRFMIENKSVKTLCVILDFQLVEHIDATSQDQKIHDIIVIETEAKHDY